MTKKLIDQMVDRFLCWELPDDFAPDCHISFDRDAAKYNQHSWPDGTNLLTATQARAMIEHMLAGVVPPEKYATEEEGEAYMDGYFDGESAKTANELSSPAAKQSGGA